MASVKRQVPTSVGILSEEIIVVLKLSRELLQVQSSSFLSRQKYHERNAIILAAMTYSRNSITI